MNLPNKQAPEPRVLSNGTELDVHSVFRTIQGEGPHSGRKAVFVRLAGCNLQCPLCDTQYTDGRQTVGLRDLCESLYSTCLDYDCDFVVLTGGEPFRQNIAPLVQQLTQIYDLTVQVETNGRLAPQDYDKLLLARNTGRFDIVISPKTSTVNPVCASLATAWKYVVCYDDVDEDGLPVQALDHPVPTGATVARPPEDFTGLVYVHPADEQDVDLNTLNLNAAAMAVLDSGDNRRRLGLQIHKYADLE